MTKSLKTIICASFALMTSISAFADSCVTLGSPELPSYENERRKAWNDCIGLNGTAAARQAGQATVHLYEVCFAQWLSLQSPKHGFGWDDRQTKIYFKDGIDNFIEEEKKHLGQDSESPIDKAYLEIRLASEEGSDRGYQAARDVSVYLPISLALRQCACQSEAAGKMKDMLTERVRSVVSYVVEIAKQGNQDQFGKKYFSAVQNGDSAEITRSLDAVFALSFVNEFHKASGFDLGEMAKSSAASDRVADVAEHVSKQSEGLVENGFCRAVRDVKFLSEPSKGK